MHNKDRILLKKTHEGYGVFEGNSIMPDIPATLTYKENFDSHIILYAKRAPLDLVSAEERRIPKLIGIVHTEEEADSRLYECAREDAEKLSRNTCKPLVDKTHRAKESKLAGKTAQK